MAVFYPGYNQILNEKPSEPEMDLLNFFRNFDASIEVFYKPYLNGDVPTFILLKKNHGLFIFEVFDLNILHYNLDSKFLIPKNSDREKQILSPFAKVDNLKSHLINLHFKELFEKMLSDYEYRKIVNTIVYFHSNNGEEFENWYNQNLTNDQTWKLFDAQVIVKGGLTKERFERMFFLSGFQKSSKYFDEAMYNNLFRYLKPSFHRVEDGTFINYTEEQVKILRNTGNAKLRKIRGVAGSGKTLLLAKMAVDEIVKSNKKVLVLTYNIALKNYIAEQINKIPSAFSWDRFEIKNYHEFFKSKARDYNLGIHNLSDFESKTFFENVKTIIEKYGAIFIDEIQDYKESWLEIIKKYFLADGGSYTVFGDEKQNIYDRPLNPEDDKRPYTGVPGKYWNVLEETNRLSDSIIEIAQKFQENFLGKKYQNDKIKPSTLPFDFKQNYDTKINVVSYEFFKEKHSPIDLYQVIHNKVRELNINPNDVAVLGSKVEYIRDVAFLFEYLDQEKTTLMSESKEDWWNLLFVQNPVVQLENRSPKFFKSFSNFCLSIKAIQSRFKSHNELFECLKKDYFRKKNHSLTNQDTDIEIQKLISDFEKTEHLIAQGNLTLEHFFPDWQKLIDSILAFDLTNELQKSFQKLSGKSSVFDLNKVCKSLPKQANSKFSKEIRFSKNIADAYYYLSDQLETIRKNKKLNFKMASDGTMKLSTIHSFKGWEIHTLFLILDDIDTDKTFLSDELVYTAITRARFNLIVLNMGMKKYNDFFNNALNKSENL